MATARQIEANRRNARRSTGPRTEAGKARSRLNALKHGKRAVAVLPLPVLPHEDPRALARRVQEWTEYLPRHRPRARPDFPRRPVLLGTRSGGKEICVWNRLPQKDITESCFGSSHLISARSRLISLG